ncbi:inorganic triphosphatase, partial [Halomonas sp.]|uniref:CYTH domain-containing protein n=1 Tax=Halomonas sp. TaxID=1486246 RepID=UPI00356A7ED3
MSQEIELKLALGQDGPEALRRHPRLRGLTPDTAHLGNTYFDTPEGDLARAQMALRLRRNGDRLVQTLKTPGQGGGGLSSRGEWEWEIEGPGLDLDELAATLAETVPLRPSDTSKAARGGALLSGVWQLPEGGRPSAWMHRAT